MRLDDIRIVKEIHFEYEWNSKLCFAKIVYLRSLNESYSICNDNVNTDEDGRVIKTYSDGFERVLCSRQVDVGGTGINADTYFIYDLRDSLVCIIPPEGTKALLAKASTSRSFAFSSDFANSHCFLWWRDGLSRMTGSKVPGGGKSVYAYDARGRLVEESSPRLIADGFRREYVYDTYDRLTTERYTGSSLTFSARSMTYYSFAGGDALSGDLAFEAESGVVTASELETTNIKGLLKSESINYAPGSANQSDGTFSRMRGYHYDAYGRVIQYVDKDSDGWLSRYSAKYDFRGNIMATKEKHKAPDGRIHYMTVTYTRDLRGRVISCSREVDGVSLPVVTYSYDDLGRLTSKSVASRISESYTYDIHGWETGRSASYAGSNVFSQTLSYASSSSSGVPGLYSGLISESVSSHNGQSSLTYGYRYDSGARLVDAVHLVGTSSSLVNTEKDITYDLNGNIKTMKRYGASVLADNLSYTYSGNRLTSVTDAVESSSYTYTYDEAGNMTSDTGKGHVRTYNVLNLPHSVSTGSDKVFRYIYLSDGTKVSAYDSSSGIGLHYRGSFVFTSDAYGNEVLSSVAHDEGRIVVSSSGSTLSYKDHWFVRDHLGSVRTVVDITSAGASLQNAVIEQNDYLPFGTRVPIKTSSSNLYRYNGKEEQQIAGTELAVLDYGARTYDPWLSRWTSIDPLAAKYHSTSPYAFCNNSPVNYVDPFGMDIWEINRNGEIKWSERSEEHRLYAVDSENNRSMDYIVVKNSDILSNLEGNGIQYYTSAGNIDDFFKIFLFAADNSDVEWALHRGKDNSYTIGTLHEEYIVGNWENFGIGKPISSVHSHPGITNNLNEERYSMSIDWKNVKEDISIPTRMNYVYFPNSKRLYFVEPIGVRYINSINKDYKRFYFGTLNHK